MARVWKGGCHALCRSRTSVKEGWETCGWEPPIRGWHTVHRLPKLHLFRMIHSCRTHGKARSTGCSFEIWQINASQRTRHQSQRRTRALVEGLVPWLGSADQERSSVLRELPSGTSCEGTFRGKLKKEKKKKRKRKEKKAHSNMRIETCPQVAALSRSRHRVQMNMQRARLS